MSLFSDRVYIDWEKFFTEYFERVEDEPFLQLQKEFSIKEGFPVVVLPRILYQEFVMDADLSYYDTSATRVDLLRGGKCSYVMPGGIIDIECGDF